MRKILICAGLLLCLGCGSKSEVKQEPASKCDKCKGCCEPICTCYGCPCGSGGDCICDKEQCKQNGCDCKRK